MNTKNLEARKYMAEAREALQRGDKESAWRLGRQAALIAPEMEDAWLVLTASDPDPHDALSYARKALEINPDSIRARRALQWAQGLAKSSATPNLSTSRNDPVERKPEHVSSEAIPTHPLKKSTQTRLYLPFLIGTGCLMFFMVALFSWNNPAFASIVNKINAPVPTQENLWASVNIPKPTITPIDVSVFVAKPADAPNPDLCTFIRETRRGRLFECAVSSMAGSSSLSIAEGPGRAHGVSSLGNAAEAASRIAAFGFTSRHLMVPTRTLDEILREAAAPRRLNFVSIDVEGHELEVLRGFSLEEWRPVIIIVEDNSNFKDGSVANHLGRFGYVPFNRTGVNDWYAHRSDDQLVTKKRLITWRWKSLRARARSRLKSVPGLLYLARKLRGK